MLTQKKRSKRHKVLELQKKKIFAFFGIMNKITAALNKKGKQLFIIID